MRRWLVEETGEVRLVDRGETGVLFIDCKPHFCTQVSGSLSKQPILRVTELSPEDSLPNFDEWNW